jgi:hypothetical protein
MRRRERGRVMRDRPAYDCTKGAPAYGSLVLKLKPRREAGFLEICCEALCTLSYFTDLR